MSINVRKLTKIYCFSNTGEIRPFWESRAANWDTEICLLHWDTLTKHDEPLHKEYNANEEDLLGGMDEDARSNNGRQFINFEATEADGHGSEDGEVEIPPTGHFDPIADAGKLFGERRQYCFSVLHKFIIYERIYLVLENIYQSLQTSLVLCE